MQPAPKILVPLLFALIAAATVVAFVVSQDLKSQPLILDKVKLGVGSRGAVFTPNGDCRRDKTRIRFRRTS